MPKIPFLEGFIMISVSFGKSLLIMSRFILEEFNLRIWLGIL